METARSGLEQILPGEISGRDRAFLLQTFSVQRGGQAVFHYRELLDALATLESVKGGSCHVPLFAICYAMLRALLYSSGRTASRCGAVKAPLSNKYQEYCFSGLNMYVL